MTNPHPLTSFRQQIEEAFKQKFGEFYVSIDSKTKAIRVVDIVNGTKVNGDDGSLIECIASGDIQKFLSSALTQQLSLVEEEIERMKEHVGDGGYKQALSDVLSRIKSGNEEQK